MALSNPAHLDRPTHAFDEHLVVGMSDLRTIGVVILVVVLDLLPLRTVGKFHDCLPRPAFPSALDVEIHTERVSRCSPRIPDLPSLFVAAER